MNTILVFIGAAASFWMAYQLTIEYNEPLLGFLFGALFIMFAFLTSREAASELSGVIEKVRKKVKAYRSASR